MDTYRDSGLGCNESTVARQGCRDEECQGDIIDIRNSYAQPPQS